MRLPLLSAALCAGMSFAASAAFAQGTEDSVASGGKFPLAAKTGQDSGAAKAAPAGAVNQGAFDMSKWKYGPAWEAPSGAKIWNPAKIKLMQGGKVTGGTVFYAKDGQTYCAMANAGYDFIWTEMQHSEHNWQDVTDMWSQCPHAKAVPGARVPNANEFDEQHALDDGALVLVIPTVRSEAEAKEAVKWAYFPPLGGRSNGGGPAFTPAFWGNVPGGYRNTINDNVVLVLMIETLDGLKDVDKIASQPGVSAIFAASGDLGNFSGYKQGDPDYERAINIVHDAALRAHVRLCGPFAWVDRPDFTCFQNTTEDGAITAGVKAELGRLADTQGKPEVGPFAGPARIN
jgi:2-keto-3-deoxy-L-rhamnonate aldolase RhmA